MRGTRSTFSQKSSFVDPRPSVGNRSGFRFIEADNAVTDALRATLERVPLLGFAACRVDCARYIRILFQQIIKENTTRRYDVVFWMGTYAPKRVPGVPMVSFAQGPPGTDARSVISRFNEVCQLAGRLNALKWRTLAQLRLSPLGLPNFRNSDRIIVGSEQSRATLHNLFGLPRTITSALPYPIDLDLFHPEVQSTQKRDAFRVLWLGRIIPRKRLDLFLKGVETTIGNGENVTATIVGNVGFIPGYERMIDRFPYPDRITWIRSVPRAEVPDLIRQHDVLAQPSEEEDFGSSVAEAQACGVPTIVGRTNGNFAYLSARDIHLTADTSECLADALTTLLQRRSTTDGQTQRHISRSFAESCFSVETILPKLEQILLRASQTNPSAGTLQTDVTESEDHATTSAEQVTVSSSFR